MHPLYTTGVCYCSATLQAHQVFVCSITTLIAQYGVSGEYEDIKLVKLAPTRLSPCDQEES